MQKKILILIPLIFMFNIFGEKTVKNIDKTSTKLESITENSVVSKETEKIEEKVTNKENDLEQTEEKVVNKEDDLEKAKEKSANKEKKSEKIQENKTEKEVIKTKKAKETYKFYQKGIASFYGKWWNGRKTANGEIYDTEKLTAAHKKLPFGTWIKVTNLSNGKSVKVRVNDRGPFVKGRIVDLTTAAFRKIEDVEKGITKVKIEIIKKNK